MSRKAEQVRGAVVTLARAGHSNQAIADLCNVGHVWQTVSKIRTKFEAFVDDGGDPDDNDVHVESHARRSDTHTDELTECV